MANTTEVSILSTLNEITQEINDIEDLVQKKSWWYRFKHRIFCTPESTKQHELRITWLALEKVYQSYQ